MSDNQVQEPELYISVFFEDKEYKVSMEAYQTNLIGLPDGRVLQANMWMESYPPQHGQLRVVETPKMENVISAQFVAEKNSENELFFE